MVSISAKDEVYFSKKFRSYPEWNWEANSTLIITYIYQLFSSHQMKLLHTWLVVKPLAQIYFQIQREITFYKIHKMIFFKSHPKIIHLRKFQSLAYMTMLFSKWVGSKGLKNTRYTFRQEDSTSRGYHKQTLWEYKSSLLTWDVYTKVYFTFSDGKNNTCSPFKNQAYKPERKKN